MELQKLYDPAKASGPMRLAIFMSGSGSNAVKILEAHAEQEAVGSETFEPVLIFTDNPQSNAKKIANQFGIPFHLNPIREFFDSRQASLGDKKVRLEYDTAQNGLLRDHKIDSVALAGYEWIVEDILTKGYLMSNVHPGLLTVKEANGKSRYKGLGWIPSAKAILDGEKNVYTSVHLVYPEVDEGPLLAVSAPQPVPKEALGLEKKVLLGGAISLKDISRFIRANPDLPDDEIRKIFPIYGFARDCQEGLKVHGDWVEFPAAIINLSSGLYEKDEFGKLYFEGNPIPNGLWREAA